MSYSTGKYIKITKSGARHYLQLVTSYRDANGRPKQRTLANLGRLEQVQSNLGSVIEGLKRVAGKKDVPAATSIASPDVTFDPARSMGDVWALTQLWKELGFDKLRKVFRGRLTL